VNATVAYSGLKIDRPEYTHFKDNKSPEYLAMFPHGKMPAFKSTSGFALVEGAAIARYLAARAPESGLLPMSLEDQALVDQWVHLVESELFDNTVFTWLLCQGKFGPYSKELHEIFTGKERRALSTINKHLEDRTYVVGDRITLADLTLANALAFALPHTLDKEQRTNFSNVIKHFELIAAEPSLKELFGGIKYAEKLIQNESPK
ncbi:hypothetical protein PILCRDRAFT_81186, partial [Piloderma croceum F 1598]